MTEEWQCEKHAKTLLTRCFLCELDESGKKFNEKHQAEARIAEALGWNYLGLGYTIDCDPHSWQSPDGGSCVQQNHLADRLIQDIEKLKARVKELEATDVGGLTEDA